MSKKLSSFKNLRIVSPAKVFLMAPEPASAGPSDIVGMEIELENIPISNSSVPAYEEDLSPYWKIKEDGSLRNHGREFISCPVFGQDIQAALAKLNSFFTEHRIKPDCSARAGLHIHMDVGDLTPDELIRLVEVYMIAEPILYAYIGGDRENNIFCLPWYKTKIVLNSVASLCYSMAAGPEDSILGYVPNLFKYSGLNLRPIISRTAMGMGDNEDNKTGGHIEFRMSTAEYKELEVLTWINILLCLKTFARDPNNYIPRSVEDASRLNGVEYFHSIFKYLSPQYMAILTDRLQENGKDINTLTSKGMRVLTYFKVVKILGMYTKAVVDQREVLFKNTHPGFKKLQERIKNPLVGADAPNTFVGAFRADPFVLPRPRG